jgi:transcriptional regulator GlxA family with amidase domain
MLPTSERTVVFLAFDGASLLDISGPLSVLTTASKFLAGTDPSPERVAPPGCAGSYNCPVATIAGGPVMTSDGVSLLSVPADSLADIEIDTLMVPGAGCMDGAVADRELVAWIARHGARARRVSSICAGTYLLAEAGLLNGKRAATHWAHCEALQARYPAVTVEPDPIFVRDGSVWTSAGISAGIDLALALVEEDHGRELAMRVARMHVVFLKRPGGQAQFSTLLQAQAADSDPFAGLHDWLMQHVSDPDLTIERLAEQSGMSLRNFARVYAAKVGRTPAKTIELFRLETARKLLEDTAGRIDTLARRAGFGDDERMRAAFQRHFGISPREYRERFGRHEEVCLE